MTMKRTSILLITLGFFLLPIFSYQCFGQTGVFRMPENTGDPEQFPELYGFTRTTLNGPGIHSLKAVRIYHPPLLNEL